MRYLFPSIILFVIFSSCSFNGSFYYTRSPYEEKEFPNSREVCLANSEGRKLYGILLQTPAETIKGYILLIHGNGGNAPGWAENALPLQKAGYDVLVFDWQGYGKSEGSPTHKNVVDDTELFLQYLLERSKGKKAVLWGESLGANLSVYIAYRNPETVCCMILEAGFSNHNEIAIDMMPGIIKPLAWILVKSPFKSDKLIKEVKTPVMIIHSTEDEVVPYRMGQELYENAAGPKEFWEITGAHCRGMSLFEKEYIERFNKWVKKHGQ